MGEGDGSGGGGMILGNSSPTLTDITFSSNAAIMGGGMILVESSPTLTNVTFSANAGFLRRRRDVSV